MPTREEELKAEVEKASNNALFAGILSGTSPHDCSIDILGKLIIYLDRRLDLLEHQVAQLQAKLESQDPK